MKIFIGLGANLGNPKQQIRDALAQIETTGLGRVLLVSSFYRTEPVGFADQPWFTNAAAAIETSLPPAVFHAGLKKIERDLGRVTPAIKNGPRRLDLDLLLWGAEVIAETDLEVPHPRMHRRRFVLVPLAEIAPAAVHPGRQQTVAELLAELTDPARVEKDLGP